MIVYLSGSIVGAKPGEANPTVDWREDVTYRLHNALDGAAETRDPLRGKDLKSLSADGLQCDNDRSLLVTRDLKDIREADVVIVNTMGMESIGRQSIGTWVEMGYAHALGIPLIIIAQHPSVLGHPFVQKLAAQIVATHEQAVESVIWMN